MACMTTAVIQCWVPRVLGMHMGQETLDKASTLTLAFPLYNTIGSCNWQRWPPSDDSWHPALL